MAEARRESTEIKMVVQQDPFENSQRKTILVKKMLQESMESSARLGKTATEPEAYGATQFLQDPYGLSQSPMKTVIKVINQT